jgi:hypothetical protein
MSILYNIRLLLSSTYNVRRGVIATRIPIVLHKGRRLSRLLTAVHVSTRWKDGMDRWQPCLAKRLHVVRAASDLHAPAWPRAHIPAGKSSRPATAPAGECFLALVATPFLPLFQEKAYAHAALGTKQHTACIPCMFVEPAAAKIDRKCMYDSKSASAMVSTRMSVDGSAMARRLASAKGGTTGTGTLCSVFSPQRTHKTRAASTTQMPLQKLPSSRSFRC